MMADSTIPGHSGQDTVPLADEVGYQEGAIVSKTLIKKPTGTITVFAFDKGEELSDHTAPFDAMVQILDGSAEVRIGRHSRVLGPGEYLLLPANIPHALKAVDRFKMVLTMIRS